ncbi:MAG: SDR family NAD(P)-dependent oxidoreductase [Microcoleaceae cyanobacterium MO_207.B10]|nr:SDR family NAD(P)-dependent oxidoreductase [Microcoleaceae cyanobacterium MO_207.B10]
MNQQKVAVILGTGSGLGAALAHRFAKENFAIVMMARTAEKLKLIHSEIMQIGVPVLSIPTDATNPVSVVNAFTEIEKELGKPDVFIYNAGIFEIAGILELTPEKFLDCWQINCFGAFLAVQQVLPGMLEKGRGTILLTGATASKRGGAKFAALAVGKFGLRALAQSLAREFSPQGIHVAHVIIDGLINTDRVKKMFPERDPQTMLSPESIAENYWQLYQQKPTTWTLELDLRPASEKF